jgi:hypothetical protein
MKGLLVAAAWAVVISFAYVEILALLVKLMN